VDDAGRISLVNSEVERLFGYTRDALLGQPVEMLLPERYRESLVPHRDRYLADPRTRPMGIGLELFGLRADGREFPVEISLGPTGDPGSSTVLAVIRDVSEHRRAELERMTLLASERRKSEQLKLAVREAHHRIKNNLQAISDLLYLEMSGPQAAAPADALRESVERIQSIALVHDLLSQEEDVQTVDTRAMAERLVPMVLRSNALSTEALELRMEVRAFPLSSKRATTLALILNELVSNAAKHALSGRPSPVLHVSLAEAEEGLLLCVQDDGPGLAEGFDVTRDSNVGLQVVRTLAERDLRGQLRLAGGPGLRAEVWFPW
jgi:PAS domain S-box-containing protein